VKAVADEQRLIPEEKMFKSIKSKFVLVLCIISALTLVACAAPTTTTTEVETIVQTVEVTRLVEGEVVTEVDTVEVTRVVETEVIVENDIRYGGTLLVGYSTEPTSFDPPKAWSTMDWGTAAQLLYNGVYVFDEDNNIAPDLAADMPEISDDGLTYTIRLKEGVLFHNGRELVADDVKYSLERNAKPDSGTWNASAPLSNIVGGQAVIDGEADTAEGIRVIDDHTLEFQLVEPDAYFVTGFTLVTNFIVPQESVEEFGEDFSFNPVGTGPFKMTEWIPGERVVFERNPDYFIEGLPYLDSIVYEIGADPEVSLLRYERGEIDVIADGIPGGEIGRVATDPVLGDEFLNTNTYLTAFIGFNLETPPFDNPDVRQAIAMAIDRDRLVQLASNTARPTYDWYPPSHYNCSAGTENVKYPYDPEAARQLLADAGHADGIDLEGRFRVVRPWLARIPEAIQQDLEAIGIRVELLQLEQAVSTEMIESGELAFYLEGWGASFPDPFNYATELFLTGSTYSNRWHYSNPEVDALITEARQNTDPESRCEQWLQMQELVMEDLPAIPLLVVGYPDLRSDRIQNFAYNHTYHRPRYEQIWIAPEDRR
jgi:ABC-type transport system substrate-binding protein